MSDRDLWVANDDALADKIKQAQKESLRHEHNYRSTAIPPNGLSGPIRVIRAISGFPLENVAFPHASRCKNQL
jgi:hypothetical protein